MALNFVTFNQDYSHMAVGTTRGFRIFYTDPFSQCHSTDIGDITLLEMLFSTSLVALVLSPRRLVITNTKRNSTICELTFPTTVLGVRLNRKRLVIILEDQIYLYDISNMKLVHTVDTSPNPHGICALTPTSAPSYLVYPLPTPTSPAAQKPSHVPPTSPRPSAQNGSLLVLDAQTHTPLNIIQAHLSPLSCIAISPTGELLATASDKGTIIRVFELPDGKKIAQFRRGTMPARVCSMCFNATASLLCVSSATDTVHVFKIADGAKQTVAAEEAAGEATSPSPTRPSSGSRTKSDASRTPRNHHRRRSSNALSEEDELMYDESLRGAAARTGASSSSSPSSSPEPQNPTTAESPTSPNRRPAPTTRTSSSTPMSARPTDGTISGMLRRTSQTVSKSFAASVSSYLPASVTEMLEPARDFAWFKIPRMRSDGSSNINGGHQQHDPTHHSYTTNNSSSLRGTGGNRGGGGASLKSVVAMSRSAPQVFVVTSEGMFLVFQIDLERGGEGALVREVDILGEGGGGKSGGGLGGRSGSGGSGESGGGVVSGG